MQVTAIYEDGYMAENWRGDMEPGHGLIQTLSFAVDEQLLSRQGLNTCDMTLDVLLALSPNERARLDQGLAMKAATMRMMQLNSAADPDNPHPVTSVGARAGDDPNYWLEIAERHHRGL